MLQTLSDDTHFDIFQCIVNIPDEVVALKTPTNGQGNNENGEMTVIKVKRDSLTNGQINPDLKFTKDELLIPGQGAENKGYLLTPQPSPNTEEPPSKEPNDTTGL